MFVDIAEGVEQCLLRHSRVASLSRTATVDAHPPDTVANNLAKFRRARVARIHRTLGEIRLHHLQRAIERARYHDYLRRATVRDAWSGLRSERRASRRRPR